MEFVIQAGAVLFLMTSASLVSLGIFITRRHG